MPINFLNEYADMVQGNEVPSVYHIWCGLSTLSHAIGRRVWTSQGFFTVRPNIYIVLVGPPGIRKSTAMVVAKNLVRDSKCAYIVPPSVTKEALLQTMCAKESPCYQAFEINGKKIQFSQASIFANEITTLLQAGGDAIGYINVLTDIWDQDTFEVSTIGRGSNHIDKPYITILGCMVPDTAASLINQNILSGGFSRRCLYVNADQNGAAVPRPHVTPEQEQARVNAITRLMEIREVVGEFDWDPVGGKLFDDWYVKNHNRINEGNSAALTGFLQGKGEYVVKIAMLLSLSESNRLILTDNHIQTAIELLDSIEPNVDKIFSATGRNILAPVTQNIQNYIEINTQVHPFCIPRTRLLSTFYKDAAADELEKILNYLVQANKILARTLKVKETGMNIRVYTSIKNEEKFKVQA